MSDFENRLRKNAKHRLRWAARQGLTAFRLYDVDLPDWPFAVDAYADWVHVMEYPRRRHEREGSLEALRAEVLRAVSAVLGTPPERVVTKTHLPKPWGRAQYERLSRDGARVVVSESGLRFEVNLTDFLDVGLFLDHRNTRARVRDEARGRRFLNLFAYTGSFTVHAMAGGARETTTVDLSRGACEWAARNLALNELRESQHHRIVCADALAWLDTAAGPFDLIVMDPPSFSASKRATRRFDVQAHHRRAVERAQALLAPEGALYFSTNFQGFTLDPSLEPAEELTPRSLPEDFRRLVHRCWRFGPSRRA